MITKRLLSIAALVALTSATALAQAPDPLAGTWKLNPAKSKAPYTSGTSVFEAAGDTMKGTVDLVGTDGTKYHWTYSAKVDGKDHAVKGSRGTAMHSPSRVSTRTPSRVVSRLAGKQTIVQTIVVAPDGDPRRRQRGPTAKDGRSTACRSTRSSSFAATRRRTALVRLRHRSPLPESPNRPVRWQPLARRRTAPRLTSRRSPWSNRPDATNINYVGARSPSSTGYWGLVASYR